MATDSGKKCLVIDKRAYVGGNLWYDSIEGINIHLVAHISHTSNSDVWRWVIGFARFNRYTNSPLAIDPDGHVYNLPFNMNTFRQMCGGRLCSELPPNIIKRLPARLVYDNNYFNDAYQGIPVGGYNRQMEKLLSGAHHA